MPPLIWRYCRKCFSQSQRVCGDLVGTQIRNAPRVQRRDAGQRQRVARDLGGAQIGNVGQADGALQLRGRNVGEPRDGDRAPRQDLGGHVGQADLGLMASGECATHIGYVLPAQMFSVCLT
eukprot:COSAG01_NODE_13990_length_1510_cov_1.404678_1_plen_121_part_00